jgi:hypothetical protein
LLGLFHHIGHAAFHHSAAPEIKGLIKLV